MIVQSGAVAGSELDGDRGLLGVLEAPQLSERHGGEGPGFRQGGEHPASSDGPLLGRVPHQDDPRTRAGCEAAHRGEVPGRQLGGFVDDDGATSGDRVGPVRARIRWRAASPGSVGLSLAATSSRATVSERTPMAAPRVAAATAVGATATTLWCPAASATRASMAVLPDPAGPTTTAPVVGEATSWRAASAWSAPSPSVSSRAARASAAAMSGCG